MKPYDRTAFLMEPNVVKCLGSKSGATKMKFIKRDFIPFIFPGLCQTGKDKSTSTFEHSQRMEVPSLPKVVQHRASGEVQ